MNERRLGIKYTVIEYNGNQQREVMDFRASPGNIRTGLNVLKTKLGIDEMKDHFKKNTKRIMEGTLK